MKQKVFKASYSLFFVSASLAFLFFLSINGCKQEDDIKPIPINLNYISNDVGRWIVYDVDSIIHLDNDSNTDNNVDTSHFQIKEVIDSIGVDGENQPIQHISRYKRLSDTLSWDFSVRWTAKITSTSYQKVEDNIRYLKLAFPINSSQRWDGNVFTTLGEEDYVYGSINEAASFGSFHFDSTLTVVQGDSTIGYHNYPYGIEKYAAGVGMYYRYNAVVDFYPGTTIIISGVQYFERINSYGHY